MAEERTKGQGSASSLRGLAYTLSIFVDRAEHRWTRDEKLNHLGQCRAAEQWLVAEARRYGVSLRFHNGGNYGLGSSLSVSCIPKDADGDAQPAPLLRTLLLQVGWEDPIALHKAILRETGAQNVHAVMHVRAPGRSTAAPFSARIDAARFLEGCAVHAESRKGVAESPLVYAHEILHLYGAWDFYQRPDYAIEQVALAKQRFANDVMLKATRDIESCEVGPVTAWRVGWRAEEGWYERLRPEGR